jgi:outer membrane murein-binding lipoprotein Lpp
MVSKAKLQTAVQKVMQVWPLVAFLLVAGAGVAGGAIKAYAQISENTSDISSLKSRVDKLETVIPDIREDLAVIKQQGEDTGLRVEHIERRLDEQDMRRRK